MKRDVWVFLDGQIMREGETHDYVLDDFDMPVFTFNVEVSAERGSSVLLLQHFVDGLYTSSCSYRRKDGKWVQEP